MEAIYNWLADENQREVPGNFLCNWRLTKNCHEDRELLVYVDGKTQLPIAYQWGGLLHSGILQVKEDMRGKGIGTKLVARRIAEAYKKNECILCIQCKPSSSIPFWEKMGFTVFGNAYDKYAYRILEKKLTLPGDGQLINIIIRFYPEDKKWSHELTDPIECFSPAATKTTDNTVYLSERVSFFDHICRNNSSRDVVIEIEINGEIIYCDKAKYEEAQNLGVRRCLNGFYLDSIQLKSATD